MKRIAVLVLMASALTSATAFGQLTYTAPYSNPDDVYNGYLAANYFTVDAGFGNTSGASVWSVGVDAMYPINNRINVEALGLYSLLSLAKDGPPFLLHGGIEFAFSQKTQQRKIPVLLSFTSEKDYSENVEINTWSAVKLQGDVKRELVARGGLYLRNSALEYVEGTTYYDITNVFHAGVYAGVGYNWESYIHVRDSDGYEFAAGRYIRPFADIMILPTSADLQVNTADVKTVKETLGWRLGGVIAGKPFTKAENFDRKAGFFANSIFRLEFGQRPLEGFYVTTGISWAFMRFK